MKTFIKYILYSIYRFSEKIAKFSNPSRFEHEAGLNTNVLLVVIFYFLVYQVTNTVITLFKITLNIDTNDVLGYGLVGLVIFYGLFDFIIDYDKVRAIYFSEKEKFKNLILFIILFVCFVIIKMII